MKNIKAEIPVAEASLSAHGAIRAQSSLAPGRTLGSPGILCAAAPFALTEAPRALKEKRRDPGAPPSIPGNLLWNHCPPSVGLRGQWALLGTGTGMGMRGGTRREVKMRPCREFGSGFVRGIREAPKAAGVF